MSGAEDKFFFSCDVVLPVKLKIESLVGDLNLQDPSSPTPATLLSPGEAPHSSALTPSPVLSVEVALFIDGLPFGLPVSTRHAYGGASCGWGEWVTLSAKYCDLTADAQLALTVWDVGTGSASVAVGGGTVSLFTKKRQLRSGKSKQRLWRGQVADGQMPTTTPGKMPKSQRGEVERLEKLVNKYEGGEVAKVEWMDKLAFKAIQKITEEENKKRGRRQLDLFLEMPTFEHPITFQEAGWVGPLQAPPPSSANELVLLFDPEIHQSLNPAEHKQTKLNRVLTRGTIDRDLKPNSTERRAIAAILTQPATQILDSSEREVLWRFRFSLTTDKRALTKFLRCADWSDAQEANAATSLMHSWAPIDIADALELLSPSFGSPSVRAYAVSVLHRADDEELQCYLLQLVQALRYERTDTSPLASFLVARGAAKLELGSFLHWYLLVEWQDPAFAARYSLTHAAFVRALLEREGPGERIYEALRRQNEMGAQLCSLMAEVKGVRGGVGKKVEKLRQILSQMVIGRVAGEEEEEEEEGKEGEEEPIPLPLDPTLGVVGVVGAESTIFRSALHPLKLTLALSGGGKKVVIFKQGDDLRQDQLVIQMVTLMDRLLKKENLDLKLTPYRVLATGADHGLVEFVPDCMPLAAVIAEHKSLLKYLAVRCGEEGGPLGVKAECLDTFVKSCAGYCVIMYLLGVGDRHLDNLMLCEDGRLFHIDFGFILGRDPKPFPPPMKLCKEMVEAMGGAESSHYVRFKSYCCEAYNLLRKSSNLILNLFHLMAGANIPDIAADPHKGILKLQHKFRLDLDDEAAVHFFQSLINESVSALFPQMVETIHRWAQYWR